MKAREPGILPGFLEDIPMKPPLSLSLPLYLAVFLILPASTELAAKDFYFLKKAKIVVSNRNFRAVKSGLSEARVKITPRPSPGRTYACKRIDFKTFAYNGGEGGEVWTKSNCKGKYGKVKFQVLNRTLRRAVRECKIRTKGSRNQTRMFGIDFPGVVMMRYCFLNMKPKTTRRKGKTTKTWKVHCGKDGIKRYKRMRVPVNVVCKAG